MTFLNYNLGIVPRDGLEYSFNYLLKLLDMLFKYKENQKDYQDMTKAIRKLKDKHSISLLKDKTPREIIQEFENTCNTKEI